MTGALEEHLDYLALKGRTDSFARALSSAVRKGDSVADLGCGFGILGLLALNAGANHVWGIEASNAVEIARETVRRLELTDHYTCIRGSTFLTNLPKLVDVLVCDHVGYFGFDYGIVAMLSDARRRMLKPGGQVIPRQIVLKVAAATGPCRRLAEAWDKPPIPTEYQWLNEHAVNTKHRYNFKPEELCGPPITIGAIALDKDVPHLLAFKANLEITQDCAVAGIACWFECELAPGVWMTNSPLATDRIDRPNAFLPCREPISVKIGEVVEASFRISHDPVTITWSLTDPSSGHMHRHSTWSSMIMNPAELMSPDTRPKQPNAEGLALKTILELLDGLHSLEEIEQTVCNRHADLFPSDVEIRRFVRRKVNEISQC